jgi:hypothetical protein
VKCYSAKNRQLIQEIRENHSKGMPRKEKKECFTDSAHPILLTLPLFVPTKEEYFLLGILSILLLLGSMM